MSSSGSRWDTFNLRESPEPFSLNCTTEQHSGGYKNWRNSLSLKLTYLLPRPFLAVGQPFVHHRTSFAGHLPFLVAIASATSASFTAAPCTSATLARPFTFFKLFVSNQNNNYNQLLIRINHKMGAEEKKTSVENAPESNFSF